METLRRVSYIQSILWIVGPYLGWTWDSILGLYSDSYLNSLYRVHALVAYQIILTVAEMEGERVSSRESYSEDHGT